MKQYTIQVLGLIFAISASAATTTYKNDKGCFAEVEDYKASKAVYLTIQLPDESIVTSSVIYRHDLKYGDVGSFCKSGVVEKKSELVTVSCGPQPDPEGYTTRGSAKVDFTNGLTSIEVKGEHLDSGKWILDLNQRCDGMSPDSI